MSRQTLDSLVFLKYYYINKMWINNKFIFLYSGVCTENSSANFISECVVLSHVDDFKNYDYNHSWIEYEGNTKKILFTHKNQWFAIGSRPGEKNRRKNRGNEICGIFKINRKFPL